MAGAGAAVSGVLPDLVAGIRFLLRVWRRRLGPQFRHRIRRLGTGRLVARRAWRLVPSLVRWLGREVRGGGRSESSGDSTRDFRLLGRQIFEFERSVAERPGCQDGFSSMGGNEFGRGAVSDASGSNQRSGLVPAIKRDDGENARNPSHESFSPSNRSASPSTMRGGSADSQRFFSVLARVSRLDRKRGEAIPESARNLNGGFTDGRGLKMAQAADRQRTGQWRRPNSRMAHFTRLPLVTQGLQRSEGVAVRGSKNSSRAAGAVQFAKHFTQHRFSWWLRGLLEFIQSSSS